MVKRKTHASGNKKGSKRGPSSRKGRKVTPTAKSSKKRLPPARKKKRYSLGKNPHGRLSRSKFQKRLSPGEKGIAEIFSRYKLPKSFPEKVTQAARAIPSCFDAQALLAEDALRQDRRDTCCITVDPADAKDFDDAVYAQKRADGTYFLSVNIADVSYYVEPGTTLDKEALRRTCSVYLANQVIPMLPFALSDDICSLVPGKDRLAMTVEIELNEEAEVIDVDVFPSIIHSRGRFSYETVEAFLKHPSEINILTEGVIETQDASNKTPKAQKDELLSIIAHSILACAEIAEKRRARRAIAGALEFESQELKFVFNKEGVPIKIQKRQPTPATRMVEEAMLLANECVAKLLAERDLKTAYRVHQAPKQECLEEDVVLLREFGLLEPGDDERILAANPHAIEAVLKRAKKTPYSFLVSQLLLRAQKKAIYLPENKGHYALQAPAYLHFTSPIRRYPDILVHRTVKALLGNTMRSKNYQLQVNNLSAMCNACSEGEKRAVDAERASDDVKMAEFYLPRIGNVEEGVIVGVEEFGCFVELAETGAQGLLPIRYLSCGNAANDWFVYDEKHMALRGEDTNITYEIGQKVKVRVESVNVVRGHVNFDLPPQKKD